MMQPSRRPGSRHSSEARFRGHNPRQLTFPGGRPVSIDGLGVVIIGRNEGERLRCCLASVSAQGLSVVYVDSNSTDSSIELARGMGASVVALDSSRPYSAA